MTEPSGKAKELFLAVLDYSADDRAAYLSAACGADVVLRQRVEALLQAHDESAGAGPLGLDSATTRDVNPSPDEGAQTTIAGRYRLLETIGEGGMGSVWVAQQTEPVRRKVAVKLIKPGMDSRQVLRRFEAERQALAVMDHPNIAKVFDGGITEQGRPYFVMEYVKGVPITQYCDDARLPVADRLRLFVQVCQAVQHAHQKGIIHRDLKPSNILVCLYDGKPVPKVIDFGLAKAMHQSSTEQSIYTAHGMMVGTPLYMSPEQAEFNNLDIDTRSDIYSLGVVLYELLTGSTPLERPQLQAAAINEILRLIKEVEPPKPSTRVSGSAGLPSIAAQRSLEPDQLRRSIQGDLDWIVMKSLEKERSRRYETANGLARDIERYLSDEPVEACPPSAAYRWKKFARKNRAAIRTVAAFVMLLSLATVVSAWLATRAMRAERLAEQAAEEAFASAKRAEEAEAQTLVDYRAATDDAMKELIGAKPELGPQDKTYLEKTLKRWQSFANRQGNDERSRAIRAEGHQRVGGAWRALGRHQEAAAELERARALWTQLVDQCPDRPEYQEHLATTHGELAISLTEFGKLAAAESEYHSASALAQSLATRFPARAEHQVRLAKLHNNLASLRMNAGRPQDAHIEYESATSLIGNLAQQSPDSPEYRDLLALYRANLGLCLLRLGRPGDARNELQASIGILDKLVHEFPSMTSYQISLARAHATMGAVLGSIAMPREALAEYQRSRDLFMRVATQFPAIVDYKDLLARAQLTLASQFNIAGQTEAALTEAFEARAVLEKLVESYPSVPRFLFELALAHDIVGDLLDQTGDYKRARAEHQSSIDALANLAEQVPEDLSYQSSRLIQQSELHARAREWQEARKCLLDALKLSPGNQGTWYAGAHVLAAIGDRESHAHHCQEMLALFGKADSPAQAERTAKAGLLLPNPDVDFAPYAALAEQAVTGSEGDIYYHFFLFVRCLAHYRMGEFERAAEVAAKCIELGSASEPMRMKGPAYLVLSMSEHRLGRHNEALTHLSLVQAAIKKGVMLPPDAEDLGPAWMDVLLAHLLLGECASLVSPPATP